MLICSGRYFADSKATCKTCHWPDNDSIVIASQWIRFQLFQTTTNGQYLGCQLMKLILFLPHSH
jgi:hypothetical protein